MMLCVTLQWRELWQFLDTEQTLTTQVRTSRIAKEQKQQGRDVSYRSIWFVFKYQPNNIFPTRACGGFDCRIQSLLKQQQQSFRVRCCSQTHTHTHTRIQNWIVARTYLTDIIVIRTVFQEILHTFEMSPSGTDVKWWFTSLQQQQQQQQQQDMII